jgi:hypothetical protein
MLFFLLRLHLSSSIERDPTRFAVEVKQTMLYVDCTPLEHSLFVADFVLKSVTTTRNLVGVTSAGWA